MFGQLVIGPCGSGKSTYCHGMYQLMTELKRNVVIFNLDPSNDSVVYDCAVDIRELVKADDAAIENDLGPNAVQIYCLDYLAAHLDWLQTRLTGYSDHYILFDCPGQFELYTDSDSMRVIVDFLTRRMKFQLVSVTLIDCMMCVSPHAYVSAVMLSLSMMINLELPHVNLLSKMDTMRRLSPEMAFKLEYYLKAGEGDLESLVQTVATLTGSDEEARHPLDVTYAKFLRSISQVVEEFSLVGFVPLAIEDKDSALHVLSVCDRANGYSFSAQGFHLQDEAYKEDTEPATEYYTNLEEKFKQGPFCSACGKDSHGKKLLACSACKKAQYCNRDCQKADWAIHKRICTYQQQL